MIVIAVGFISLTSSRWSQKWLCVKATSGFGSILYEETPARHGGQDITDIMSKKTAENSGWHHTKQTFICFETDHWKLRFLIGKTLLIEEYHDHLLSNCWGKKIKIKHLQ